MHLSRMRLANRRSTEDKFDFTKLSLEKQDDKMTVIKGTNVTVNWYKSTKTLQIQGVNEQMVKQHLDELIWTSNHNGSQVITDQQGHLPSAI